MDYRPSWRFAYAGPASPRGRGFLLTRGGRGARVNAPGIPPAAWRPCGHLASTPAFFWMRACFLTARTGPPGRAVHFWEFSASRGDCIRAGSVFLGQRHPSMDNLGWRTASGAAITRVSRRAGPQDDADRAASPIRGAAGGGRDAEKSGFCTVQAGVRWDEKGCPRHFMHDASEIMQDHRVPCAGYPDWVRHMSTVAVFFPRRARIKRRWRFPCIVRGLAIIRFTY